MTDLVADTARTSLRGPIKTTGILHFTIGVRDHMAAAKFYSELLGCRHLCRTIAIRSCNAGSIILSWRRFPIT